MSNQIQGMKQANDNSQQANNLIQTAENGLNDISGMLSRMRELAVQAATDTLNNTDRASRPGISSLEKWDYLYRQCHWI